jgi:hypothetical protein
MVFNPQKKRQKFENAASEIIKKLIYEAISFIRTTIKMNFIFSSFIED